MRAIREVETGSTIFVQSCVRMMSAAWIKLQMVESSAGSRRPRATMASISGIAYSMRYTIASDIGMAFELGIKTVMQGLSPKEDGKPQVPNSHDLLADLWEGVPEDIRSEIDASAASWVGNVFGRTMPRRCCHFPDTWESTLIFSIGLSTTGMPSSRTKVEACSGPSSDS